MRKILFYILNLIIIMTSTGCDGVINHKNIDEILFARVIAVDKSDTDSGNVKITAAYQVPAGGEADDSSSKKTQSAVISSEGRTVFDAVKNVNSFSDRKIFLGQVDYILFSEEVAADGLLQYMDFFARYYEVNLNTDIFIVKGTTAQAILDAAGKSEYFISKYLKNLLGNSQYLSISGAMKLKDIVRTLDKSYLSPYIPVIRLKESSDQEKEHDIEMDGYAIFDGEKLAGYLTGKEARGLNWVTDRIISGTIIVQGNDGKDIALEIHSSKTKVKPVFENGELMITISVDMSSNISEQTSPEDIYNQQTLEYLKSQQEQTIRQEIAKAMAFAQERRADVFGIGDIVYHQDPIKWQNLQSNWLETFANLAVNVEVISEIKRTFIIKQPTRSEIFKSA
ncbi:MAG: Ger(x)C family spore germination protein [Syntrophomonadaceae bacterium]|nr:Ger(x)C family spore germination protein [Syntrophomonadaceae bacterium]